MARAYRQRAATAAATVMLLILVALPAALAMYPNDPTASCDPLPSEDGVEMPANAELAFTLYAAGNRNWTCLEDGSVSTMQREGLWWYGSDCTELPDGFAGGGDDAGKSDFSGYGYYYDGGDSYTFKLTTGNGVPFAALHFNASLVTFAPAPDGSPLPLARGPVSWVAGSPPFPNIAYVLRSNSTGGTEPEGCGDAAPGEWVAVPFYTTYELYACDLPGEDI